MYSHMSLGVGRRVHRFAPPGRLQAMASEELARAAVHVRDTEGLPIVGFDLAGSEHVCSAWST
jgi:hypothetical protein